MARQQKTYFDFHSLENPQTTVLLKRTGQYIEQELSNSLVSNNISESSYDFYDFSV